MAGQVFNAFLSLISSLNMTRQETIEISLQEKFKTEHLKRIIDQCNDINILKQIALELLALNQQKTAIAHWSTKRALKAEQSQLSKLNKE